MCWLGGLTVGWSFGACTTDACVFVVVVLHLSCFLLQVKISSTARNPPKNANFKRVKNGSLLLTWDPPDEISAGTLYR